MGDRTRMVIEHAVANGGIVTTSEAQALGMDRKTLARRVQAGVFTRLKRGVVALPGVEVRHQTALAAACRRLDAVVSHGSAGELHGFDGLPWAVPSVTVPHRLTHAYPGVYVHQSTDISDESVVTISGLPVTTAERTIIDLAALLPIARMDWILDRALATGTVDLDKLSTLFSNLARRGKPGTTKLRSLLEKRDEKYVPIDSVLEQRLLALIVEWGLPRPVSQFHAPWLVPTNGRVDFAYTDHRLVIEADSRKWHTLMQSFEMDRQRDNLAQIAGWRILRFTWKDIVETPDVVADTIRAGLAD